MMQDIGSYKFRFQLRTSEDNLFVYFDGSVYAEKIYELYELVCDQLEMMHVTPIPPKEHLTSALLEAIQDSDDDQVLNVVIMKGKAPVPAKDGHIEWGRDFFSKEFVMNEKTGQVDFRASVGDPAVEADEFLARIHPPTPGKEGIDVFGGKIVPDPGKLPVINCGANVRAGDSEEEFFAETDGRVKYSENKLNVDSVFHIKGNVGLASGNIEHSGALMVEGDIETGTEVSVRGDVEVKGVIEGANVVSGGDIHVHCGVTGSEDKSLTAKGCLKARFLVETTVIAEDDIVVESETMNSHIRTQGSFIMPKGRVVGGYIEVCGNIYVNQAGSEGNVPTRLSIVTDKAAAAALSEKEEEIKSLCASINKIKEMLTAMKKKRDAMKDGAAQALSKLADSVAEMQEEFGRLESERDEFLKQMQRRGRPQMVFKEVLYPETMLEIYNHRYKVTEMMLGPVRAVLSGGIIEFKPVE